MKTSFLFLLYLYIITLWFKEIFFVCRKFSYLGSVSTRLAVRFFLSLRVFFLPLRVSMRLAAIRACCSPMHPRREIYSHRFLSIDRKKISERQIGPRHQAFFSPRAENTYRGGAEAHLSPSYNTSVQRKFFVCRKIFLPQ